MVFSVIKNGVKLSFRSCIKEVSASEMAQEVCRDMLDKAGADIKEPVSYTHLIDVYGFFNVW